MEILRCMDESTKNELIKQGFKLMGIENVCGNKVFLFSNPMNLKMSNKNVFKSNKLHF